MVFIVSSDNDSSTSSVIKYLLAKNKDFIRLGESQAITLVGLELSRDSVDMKLRVGGREFFVSEISSFWHRKRGIHLLTDFNFSLNESNAKLRESLCRYLRSVEAKALKDFLYFLLEKKKHLGNSLIGDANKLISFEVAKSIGLEVPTTRVLMKKSDCELLDRNIKYISKPIQDVFDFIDDEKSIVYSSVNRLINWDEELELVGKIFFPSLIQEYVDKKVELRIFYLNKKMYSMAIFSQNNEKTKIDFRNYDDEKPNRCVPCKLPQEISEKIIKFMDVIGLQTGSIDMILTEDNRYVFLEVNPVGQYGMVGKPCNYNLDELIALELLKYEKESS